jgi:hypothetical protein
MLTPVPWQTHLLVHTDLLVKLEQIQTRLGRPPMLYRELSAWRSYAEQKELYERLPPGMASSPDFGNRTHMRGVAADLADVSPTMQRACVAVGLQRDPAEAWHWQLPTFRNYPIIPTYTPPVEIEPEEPLMSAAYLFAPAASGKPARYALVGLDVPGGSHVTLSTAEAQAMGFVYGNRAETDGVGAKNGSPVKQITQAQLDATVTFYAARRAEKVAEERSSGGSADLTPVLAAVADVHADVNKPRTVS